MVEEEFFAQLGKDGVPEWSKNVDPNRRILIREACRVRGMEDTGTTIPYQA